MEPQVSTADRDPIAFLTERITLVEDQRDALAAKAQRLELLQHSFVEITAARDERRLAAAALRGARLGLGFSRALWFAIERDTSLNAVYELDGEDVIDSDYGGTLPAASLLNRIANGVSDAAMGNADDVDAPLFDTRRWYAAAAIRVRSGVAYILYADGSADRTAASWAVNSLQELAVQAAFSLDTMRMASELERLAMHDPLTGLLNRRALMERMKRELATVRRTGDPLAFAMIDVDDFKAINDRDGHAAGDTALRTIARIFQSATREIDITARFAGDEFSLIMPRTSFDGVQRVMERIYGELAKAGLPCSTGIAFASRTTSVDDLFAAADAAVYSAKAKGKNGFAFAPLPS